MKIHAFLMATALAAAAVSPVAAQAPSGPPGGPPFSSAQTQDTGPYPHGPGSLAGVWHMTGYRGSANSTARQRIATDLNGNIPPLLPWAKKLLEQRVNDADNNGKIFANTASECLPQGTPYILFGAVEGPIQIFEEQNQVTFISFEQNEVWFTYLNQKHPKLEDIEPTYHGDSVDHWEGDTLVIDSVGINTKTTLDQVGMPHSDALRVITKIKRISANQLEFLITIDDPKIFSAPWTRRLIYMKAQPGERVKEYACENNHNAPSADGFQGFDFH